MQSVPRAGFLGVTPWHLLFYFRQYKIRWNSKNAQSMQSGGSGEDTKERIAWEKLRIAMPSIFSNGAFRKPQSQNEEYRKLADEKEQFKREKQYHAWEEQKREQKKERKAYESESTLTMKPELFFRGVGNELMLKKRYKDLIKIYHPDNVAGDTRTVQEINKEYEKMKQLFL